jgi:hypothetical protein
MFGEFSVRCLVWGEENPLRIGANTSHYFENNPSSSFPAVISLGFEAKFSS